MCQPALLHETDPVSRAPCKLVCDTLPRGGGSEKPSLGRRVAPLGERRGDGAPRAELSTRLGGGSPGPRMPRLEPPSTPPGGRKLESRTCVRESETLDFPGWTRPGHLIAAFAKLKSSCRTPRSDGPTRSETYSPLFPRQRPDGTGASRARGADLMWSARQPAGPASYPQVYPQSYPQAGARVSDRMRPDAGGV